MQLFDPDAIHSSDGQADTVVLYLLPFAGHVTKPGQDEAGEGIVVALWKPQRPMFVRLLDTHAGIHFHNAIVRRVHLRWAFLLIGDAADDFSV